MYARSVRNVLLSTLYEECFWIMKIIIVRLHLIQNNDIDDKTADEAGENDSHNPKDGRTEELLDYIKLQKKAISLKQEACEHLQQSVNELQTATTELKRV